jgi:hypothetical protein
MSISPLRRSPVVAVLPPVDPSTFVDFEGATVTDIHWPNRDLPFGLSVTLQTPDHGEVVATIAFGGFGGEWVDLSIGGIASNWQIDQIAELLEAAGDPEAAEAMRDTKWWRR